MSLHKTDGSVFHTRGPAAAKLVVKTVVCSWDDGTTHVPIEADQSKQ